MNLGLTEANLNEFARFDNLKNTVDKQKAKEYFENKGYPFSLRLVPFHIMERIKEAVPEMKWADDRPNYDYIYLTQDLIDLAGRDFHKKKHS